ncbi:MAG: hypothetical protein K5773_03650 [Pseudobutyrivibrio sp.]|nr:hypothetical protein [Pseudobutyrivibrio sp.]
MRAPDISSSTKEERANYIKETYRCIADCDNCGICAVLRGKTPELAFADYIDGAKEYFEVAADYR